MTNHERARDDARMANHFGRSGMQACILINGGAATALLAYSHAGGAIAMAPTSLLRLVIPLALTLYAGGVFLGASAFMNASEALSQWMLSHEGRGSSASGDELWSSARSFVFWGLRCFAAASIIVAFGLLV
jgi:hypothetical protein